jgi:hypothetical protein
LKVCPVCELDASNEYTDSAQSCSECGAELVDKLTFQSQIKLPSVPLNKPALMAAIFRAPDRPVQDRPESDAIRLKVCPQCELDTSHEFRDSAIFCGKCGARLVDKTAFQSELNQCLTRLAVLDSLLRTPDNVEADWTGKNKKTALILAIFLGPFTWLYTYRRDAVKAAIGLGLASVALMGVINLYFTLKFLISGIYTDFPESAIFRPFFFVCFFVYIAIWLWAIIDTIQQKQWSWPGTETRNKTTAVLLAVFLTPWTWFYTYKKDAWKFWLSWIILNGGTLAIWIFISFEWTMPKGYFTKNAQLNGAAPPFFANMAYIIWAFTLVYLGFFIYAVVTTANRSEKWYQQYSQAERKSGIHHSLNSHTGVE